MKAHYEVLDGLRGTAAICVVIFHIFELVTPDYAHNPMHHGFLAVDFFFVLSGFVVGYAYDDRMARGAPPRIALTFWEFAKRRLIRLHPMVIISATWAVLVFLCDPLVGNQHTVGVAISAGKLALIYALSLFLLPTPGLPTTFGETHSLNGPTWTLLLEYIANVVYGLFAHRLKLPLHIALCILAAIALVLTAMRFDILLWGWSWPTLWVGYVRLTFPFLTGLLIYRMNLRLRVPAPYLLCSILLVAAFMIPTPLRHNGLLEAGFVIVAFPLIVMMGASIEKTPGWLGRLCRFSGQLSYPLYIIHYPLIYVFGHWAWSTHATPAQIAPVAIGLFATEIALATLVLYAYDLPVRAWLTARFIERSKPVAVPVAAE
jgi:peptidoglycan/LPS O-acetylase OafA/YrhL